jgi:hypothetical protein
MVVPRKPRKIRGHPGASWHPCAKHAHAAHFSEPFSTLGISWDPISATSAEGRTGQRNDVPKFHFRAGSVGSRWSGQRSSEVKPQPEQCWSTRIAGLLPAVMKSQLRNPIQWLPRSAQMPRGVWVITCDTASPIT